MRSLIVTVATPPTLREFLISRNGGNDTIKLKSDDVFVSKIIHMLKSPPKDYTPKHQYDSVIRIKVPSFRICNSVHNGLVRFYLSTRDQQIIVDEWNSTFKEIFHNYVLAYCRGMNFKVPCQKMAILSFCEDYNIPMENVNYDTLKKSWDRLQYVSSASFHLIRRHFLFHNTEHYKCVLQGLNFCSFYLELL